MFGIKGGAAGGGLTQVVPMEDLNLHFTGDIHAIGAANNLLAALLDASILHGNPHKIDALRIGWRRALDMNDRALRQVALGLGGRANGYPRESGFDITAASEVMAILAVSRDLHDLRQRLGAITVAHSYDGGKPVTAEDLGAAGAMTVLLKDALKPNLIQTLEGQPCLMHAGPFANIAHGNSSLVADLIGQKLGDYVITESGFGSDMGMEKFFDIVCRKGGLTPSAVVLVATVRALKHHGGLEDDPRADSTEALAAVEQGAANLVRHLGIVKTFGLPCVVAVNRRPGDTDEEVALVKKLALDAGAFGAEVNDGFSNGGEGAADLAQAVADACEQPNEFSLDLRRRRLDRGEDLQGRHEGVRGEGRDLLPGCPEEDPSQYNEDGLDKLPICMAKTHLSLSRRPDAPERAGGLRAAGARHPGVHRSRLAGAAVRRHPADARTGQGARGAERGHRRGGPDGRPVLAGTVAVARQHQRERAQQLGPRRQGRPARSRGRGRWPGSRAGAPARAGGRAAPRPPR